MKNLALVLLSAVAGCGGASSGGGAAVTATVGALGGVIQVPNGPSLAIVPGSLAADTAITITPRSTGLSGALSTVYDFTPAGLTFARPATLSIPVDPSLTAASLMVTAGSSTASLPALVDNGLASAQVTQLSTGYAAASKGKTRTVSGVITTVYVAGDGTKTTLPGSLGPQASVTAAWVPSGSNYRKIPITPAPTTEGAFVINGVPEGPYFLQVDTLYPPVGGIGGGTFTNLYEFTTDSPDLSNVAAARPGVETGTGTLTFSATGLTPWTAPPAGGFTGDLISFVGLQNNIYGRPGAVVANPAAGSTAWSASFDWASMNIAQVIGLPDASKGDVEFFYQRTTSPVGTGATAGQAHVATRYASISDLTLHDGGTATAQVAMQPAPMTGSLRANLGNSKWAQIVDDSFPGSQPEGPQGVTVLAIPHSTTYPDTPGLTAGTSLAFVQGPALQDVDYGTIPYGQFLGPAWKELRYELYSTVAQMPQPGTSELLTNSAVFVSYEAMPATDQIVPVLGAPRSPKINGHDAFQALTGVGTHPTISWSPPRLGSATSYNVSLYSTDNVLGLTLHLYGVTSMQVPEGILHAGTKYYAVITAVSAPWDALDISPFRWGMPYFSADGLTAVFTP